ncbi:hypothetical protein G4B88_018805 [Cannabis sativa]|uniref:Zinc knuckle CX2CX4HX4C domain-containing protein n=1 Tax=Cannabis sativa TaxID=3483 RepID=A0A7J6EKZ8_CANSA|nr:hypothetical protein G4B88_018805 [Cannabis sativa]
MEHSLAGSNSFRFMFENDSVCKRVSEHGPWCVKGNMLVLLSWSFGFGVKVLAFNSIRFWVQIHSLPHDYFSRVNANLLGALAGKVEFIELDETTPITWKRWIRVLVEVDVCKPQSCGFFFKLPYGVNQWIQLKYEKLENFRYMCGMWGHQWRDCKLESPVTVLNETNSPFPLFGPWMNTHSLYTNCFSGKVRVPPCLVEEEENVAEGVSLDLNDEPPTVVPELAASGPPAFTVPCARRSTLRSIRGRCSSGRGGAQVRRAWRPKPSAAVKGNDATLGVPSLSPQLGFEKEPAPLLISEDFLNCSETGDVVGIRGLKGTKSLVNPISLTGVVGRLTNDIGGPNMVVQKSKDNGPLSKTCGDPSRQRLGLSINGIKILTKNISSIGGSGSCTMEPRLDNREANLDGDGGSRLPTHDQNQSDHFDEKRALFTRTKTTPVKKRRLDVDTHSLKIVPKWNMRRVKCVVRDFPRGVGPRGIDPPMSWEHDGFGNAEEPSIDEGNSPNMLSAGCSQHVDKLVSAGQSLTAWKARARLADIAIPSKNHILINDKGSPARLG